MTLAPGAPPPRCSETGNAWCVARRFEGTAPGGELGFRFGEPLDVDGDGTADLAAGARYRKDGVHVAGEAGVWSGATGRLLRTWKGPLENGIFGHWVLAVPDLDGDRRADVVIAAPNGLVGDEMYGVVTARSPATGRELWRRSGSTPWSQLGWDLAIAGDHDGDGRVDLFVGHPGTNGGRAHLVSGKDGAVLRTYAPPSSTPSFGWYVARVDDLDGDGRADLAVGTRPGYAPDDPPNGAAYVMASGSGKELHRWTGDKPGSNFGEVVAALGDLDGDGRGEVVVSAPGTNWSRDVVGEVHVYSGATGTELRRWRGSEAGELYGRMIVGAGDLDGDGADDLAIGAPWHRVGADDCVGRVELRSGRSGAVIATLVGEGPESWFGWHIRRAPDPDGLGRPALLIGSLRQPVAGVAGGGVVDLWVHRTEASGTGSAPLRGPGAAADAEAPSSRR